MMKNFSIIIASYLGKKFEGDVQRLDVLIVTVKNLRFYFPEAEIIVMFDKVGWKNRGSRYLCYSSKWSWLFVE